MRFGGQAPPSRDALRRAGSAFARNLAAPSYVFRIMSILKRLLGKAGQEPKKRIRVCIECGMPIAEHKDWCSILRGQREMERQASPAE
ncbi:MAG: hypothetical protein HY655_03295 [Acidobacteria bacterium]|nr:hypothetical protein [Acidobacteriota bacterium]